MNLTDTVKLKENEAETERKISEAVDKVVHEIELLRSIVLPSQTSMYIVWIGCVVFGGRALDPKVCPLLYLREVRVGFGRQDVLSRVFHGQSRGV